MTENDIAYLAGLIDGEGSIYYKLGDIQRATVNWNIALKLDPEYNEVRSVLLAIKNNEQIILPE